MTTAKERQTLSREEWLERALEVVSRAGGAKLRVDRLVSGVGVSKGSFYWHFKDRDQFVIELIDFWHERYTLSVARHFDSIDATAAEKLRQLMEVVFVDRLTRYDLAIRSWAIAEPKLRARVKRTDAFRIDYLTRLFQELGFDDAAADLRSRVFVASVAWEAAQFARMNRAERVEKARVMYEFLVANGRQQPVGKAS
jgi:AcrR family transcriptional regulator